MPDHHMPPAAAGVNADCYLVMCADRRAFLASWRTWLRGQPLEHVATEELMTTQAAVRDLHDLETGRPVLGECGQ